jgi:membrane-bound inhibitor of C-type lysozyme
LKLSAWAETSGYACTKKPMTIIVRQKSDEAMSSSHLRDNSVRVRVLQG